MKSNLRNYTSSVPVQKTILRIELALIKAGAIGIIKQYKEERLEAISFSIPSPNKWPIAIRLPANVDAVYRILTGSRNIQSEKSWREQAERTAWKLMQDWVEIQLSLIKMEQVEMLQVFLPYVWDGKQTYYSYLKANGFKLLPSGKKENKE